MCVFVGASMMDIKKPPEKVAFISIYVREEVLHQYLQKSIKFADVAAVQQFVNILLVKLCTVKQHFFHHSSPTFTGRMAILIS